MVNLIALASVITALAPSVANAPQAKPTPAPSGTIIVRLLPVIENVIEPNYVVETEKVPQTQVKDAPKQVTLSADERFEEMKKVLNARFKKMFELKSSLDKTQAETSGKWEEYWAMNQAYNKELKKIIAIWVTDNMY